MKTFLLSPEIRNAILADLAECPAKHVIRAMNTLMTLKEFDLPEPTGEEVDASVLARKNAALASILDPDQVDA